MISPLDTMKITKELPLRSFPGDVQQSGVGHNTHRHLAEAAKEPAGKRKFFKLRLQSKWDFAL